MGSLPQLELAGQLRVPLPEESDAAVSDDSQALGGRTPCVVKGDPQYRERRRRDRGVNRDTGRIKGGKG